LNKKLAKALTIAIFTSSTPKVAAGK